MSGLFDLKLMEESLDRFELNFCIIRTVEDFGDLSWGLKMKDDLVKVDYQEFRWKDNQLLFLRFRKMLWGQQHIVILGNPLRPNYWFVIQKVRR